MKKIYKIITSISVFLIVLFVGVALVVGNTNKQANAGVIVETTSIYLPYTGTSTKYDTIEEIGEKFLIGISYTQTSGNVYLFRFDYYDNQNTYRRNNAISITGVNYVAPQTISYRYSIYVNGTNTVFTHSTTFDFAKYNNETYLVYDIKYVYNTLINDLNGGTIDGYFPLFGSTGIGTRQFTRTSGASIAPCTNIYDLENKSFCLLYLSDISGIASEQMRDEITINWGFIDSTDNELYAEYAPTISAQNLNVDDDTIIRLGVPLNNSGSAMDYYDVSQKALLSTIDSSQGGASSTAHIYGIYVWRNLNMIEWGLAEFDTTSTPTSGASMNYLTSTTRLYQYQNIDTSTMTCRLSVSSNFNFITIKNQEQVNVSSVNAVIRQGGFMPAWALYNWARGSHSGFTSGEQYGAAPYQEGNAGYNAIFQAGRQAGLNENIGTQTWFMKIFQGVDAFLNIRIFPNITFGVLLGIPFINSVVCFIIRYLRCGFGS